MKRATTYSALFAVATSALAAIAACSASSSPNPHDDVVNDTQPAPTTTTPPDTDAGPSPFPVVFEGGLYDSGGGYMNEVPDGYSPIGTCKACNCQLNPSPPPADASDDAGPPPPAGYCIGGLPGNITPPASCAAMGSAPAVGCNVVPAACAGLAPKEACPCILSQKIDFGCYAVCAVQGSGVAVYCPNP